MVNQKGFRARLRERQEKAKTLVCIGLDPLPEKLPISLKSTPSQESMTSDIGTWMKGIVDYTAEFACMFKLQIAHYEALLGGMWMLKDLISHIKKNHPDIPIMVDCKRGDIGRTQERYREALFEILDADAVNFSPYMGKDCMEFLVNKDHPEKSLVGLCYTSNPSAREVQDMKLVSGLYLWERIAELTLEWAEQLNIVENTGLVMAAAHKKEGRVNNFHLKRVREVVGDKLWFLIPGIGTQGGELRETVHNAWAGFGSMAINSSSEIDFASSKEDFGEAAAKKAEELRDKINIEIKVLEGVKKFQSKIHYDALNNIEKFFLCLERMEKIKFGAFKLKLHEKHPEAPLSPIYLNIRDLPEDVDIFENGTYHSAGILLAKLVMEKISILEDDFDYIVGIPKAGEPLAEALALILHKPLLKIQKEENEGGRKISNKIDLPFEKTGKEKILLVDDLITQADTKLEAINSLKENGLNVIATLVLVDREQGGVEELKRNGHNIFAVATLSELLEIYEKEGCITKEKREEVIKYIKENRVNSEAKEILEKYH